MLPFLQQWDMTAPREKPEQSHVITKGSYGSMVFKICIFLKAFFNYSKVLPLYLIKIIWLSPFFRLLRVQVVVKISVMTTPRTLETLMNLWSLLELLWSLSVGHWLHFGRVHGNLVVGYDHLGLSNPRPWELTLLGFQS